MSRGDASLVQNIIIVDGEFHRPRNGTGIGSGYAEAGTSWVSVVNIKRGLFSSRTVLGTCFGSGLANGGNSTIGTFLIEGGTFVNTPTRVPLLNRAKFTPAVYRPLRIRQSQTQS